MDLIGPFNLFWALIIQIILSCYYIYFVVRPLMILESKSKEKNYSYVFFIIRVIGIALLDLFYPSISVFIDFILAFLLSFTVVPWVKKKLFKY